MSAPIREAGNNPTAPVILVLPPTQSGKSKISNQFSLTAKTSNLLPFDVIAIARDDQFRRINEFY